MNKKQTLALLAVLSLASASCQKETIKETLDQPSVEVNRSSCVIAYSIDGTESRITVTSPSERTALISWLVGMAEENHKVTFREIGNDRNISSSKDTQTFSSSSKEEVVEWAENMSLQGYVVTIEYDKTTGLYTGTAVK